MNIVVKRALKSGKAIAALRQLAAGEDISNTAIHVLRKLQWVTVQVTRVYDTGGPRKLMRPTITDTGREALAAPLTST